MKKLCTLLLLTITAFTFKAGAQNTTCSAGFSFAISGLSVNFTPALTTVSTTNHHYWSFGDGAISSDISPTHIYVQGGSYKIKHYFYKSENGVAVCVDSLEKEIQLSSVSNIPCNADFTFAISGLSATFTPSVTAGLSNQYWLFGDGTFSYATSPTHTYNISGSYIVKHYFYRTENQVQVCMDSIEKHVEFTTTVSSCNLHAKYSFLRDPSLYGDTIHFVNESSWTGDNPKVKWSFGDGTYSTDFSTSHLYKAPGLYTVCLTLTKENGCQRDTCTQIQVQATPSVCNLTAYFAFHADSLQSNKIHFTNYSFPFENSDSIRWTFGDGTTSNDVNPTHIYTLPGTYNVCIRVQKKASAGSTPCVKEICKSVVVLSPCNLQAYFSYQFDPLNPNKVYFVNHSSSATAISNTQWNFGDGTTSVLNNPDHTYAHSGIYNVCVHVSSSTSCTKEYCKTVEIKEPEVNCADASKFTFTRSTVNCLEFKFVPVNQNPNWKYVWTFGDGTTSNVMLPAGHVYPRSGNYTVYLTIYRTSSPVCVSTSHQLAETGTCFSCNNIWVKYQYTKESVSSNKFFFHTLSNYPVLSQTWTITKLNVSGATVVTLTGMNPDYTFKEPGDYVVCLRAVTYGNCVKEYCEVIHIIAPNSVCTLTSYPNPASNQVTLSLQLTESVIIHVYIYNSLNILVKQKDQQGFSGNNVITTNIEGLVPGSYIVKVIYGNRICYAKFQKL